MEAGLTGASALGVAPLAGQDVCVHLFRDANGNGMRDAKEKGLAGVGVRFYGPDSRFTLAVSGTTNTDGRYCASGLAPGTYATEIDPLLSNPLVYQDAAGRWPPVQVEVLGRDLNAAPNALAFTGLELTRLLRVTGLLLLVGGWFLWPRRRPVHRRRRHRLG